MTNDERDILLHTVAVLTVFMERLGQYDLADQYSHAVRDPVKRVLELKKLRDTSPTGDANG